MKKESKKERSEDMTECGMKKVKKHLKSDMKTFKNERNDDKKLLKKLK